MTAIQATFVDCRSYKTGGTYRLIFEVPQEMANQTLRALGGVPDPANPQWVGIAPLDAEKATEPEPRKEMTRAQWAGMLCQDERFQKFIPAFFDGNSERNANPEYAADRVREFCGVDSRSDLNEDDHAAECWDALKAEFDVFIGRIAGPR